MMRLGDATEMLVGFAFKSAGFLDAVAEGIPLLRGENVQQGYIRWGDKTKKWSIADSVDLERYRLAEGDVILAMDRPIVGDGLKMAWIKPDDLPSLLVQRVCRLRGVPGVSLTNYIRYVLAAPEFSAHIHSITTGANIPHISSRDISAYEFHLPSLDDQERISEVLSAYDDLIATNQRRIALLEDAARLLYREWFVHLRFPGHELVPVRDGVPQGWEKVAIGSLIDFHIGGGWGKDADDSEASDAAFVIRGTDIPRIKAGLFATVPLRYHPAKGLASRKLQPGDLVFEVSGGSRDQGVCRLLPISSTLLERFQSAVMCASFCKLIRPRVGSSEYIGFTLDYLRLTGVLRTYENQSASNIVNFGFSDFCDKHLIFKVPGRLLESFRELLAPLLEQCDQIAASQEKIIQARDLLLPKLMSGQLDVSSIPLPDEVHA